MVKPALSTVSCPEWTLERVAQAAQEYGFEAVELRTLGEDSRRLACDPALTDERKVRRIMGERGVEVLSLATSVRFDEAIRSPLPGMPAIMGLVLGDTERSVREARRAVDLAVALECPLVRVFGFEVPAREKPAKAVTRIRERLALVLDHAHNTGVRLVLENGGSFPRADDIARIIGALDSPLLGACYALAAGCAAGDSPEQAVGLLGPRLWAARIKDIKAGRPCPLGQGELSCRRFAASLVKSGFDGPLVFEWDHLWFTDLDPAEKVLPGAAKTLFGWIAEAMGVSGTGNAAAASTRR